MHEENPMEREQFIRIMDTAKQHDLTQGCSIFTPPWPGEKALEIHFFKRVTGAYGGGLGANGQLIQWSNTVGTHLVGETAFHSGSRAIADVPLKDLCGPGAVFVGPAGCPEPKGAGRSGVKGVRLSGTASRAVTRLLPLGARNEAQSDRR
jgi:hypothetical protein